MGETITTVLLSENPNGIKNIWVEGKICNCTYLTRNDLTITRGIDELNEPALYFLFGKDKKVYIGETENFNKRIKNHKRIKDHKDKDFWDEIIVFTAKGNSLDKSQVQYLECLALDKTKEYKNYTLENDQDSTPPTLKEHKIEIVKKFFEEIVFISSFLNFNLFKDFKETKEKEQWFCKVQNIDAKGVYDGKSFIVLEGSIIAKTTDDSYGIDNDAKKEKREQIISEKTIEKNNVVKTTQNIEFSSPSAASSFCLGSNSNGRKDWKNKAGKTMNDTLYK